MGEVWGRALTRCLAGADRSTEDIAECPTSAADTPASIPHTATPSHSTTRDAGTPEISTARSASKTPTRAQECEDVRDGVSTCEIIEAFAAYLDTVSKFHRCSMTNQLLIAM